MRTSQPFELTTVQGSPAKLREPILSTASNPLGKFADPRISSSTRSPNSIALAMLSHSLSNAPKSLGSETVSLPQILTRRRRAQLKHSRPFSVSRISIFPVSRTRLSMKRSISELLCLLECLQFVVCGVESCGEIDGSEYPRYRCLGDCRNRGHCGDRLPSHISGRSRPDRCRFKNRQRTILTLRQVLGIMRR